MMDFVLVLIALVHVHAQTSLIEVTQYNALVALFDSLGVQRKAKKVFFSHFSIRLLRDRLSSWRTKHCV